MTSKIAFVLGNGTSRRPINPEKLKSFGTTYGCNALYRTFAPDHLIAVDTKMILEITETRYQIVHKVWTNKNKAYDKITNLNYIEPMKGWSSGPSALWLSCFHGHEEIYILGFDYIGLENNTKVNNIYTGTQNYKNPKDRATYHGNWLRQTITTIKEFKNVNFIRVIEKNGYVPKEMVNIDNIKHETIEKFNERFNIL